jgi:helix-turn-helix protein
MTSFNAQKFAWIDRLFRDRNVPHLACRVAMLISNHLNRTSGDAWPSQRQLAADIGVCRRTIQYALEALVETGHLAVQVSRGDTNHYRPIFETKDAQSGAQVDVQPVAHVERGDAQSGATDLRNLTTGGCARPFVHNPSKKNPIKRNPERKSLTMIGKPTSEFEEFWRAYPRKVEKLKAEKIYAGILKQGRASPDDLIAGATRYAAERANEDPRYTKHPSTWLNGGCWADEPKPQSGFAKPSRADSAIAGMRGYLEEGNHGE